MTYKIINYTTNEEIIATGYDEFRHIMTMCALDFIKECERYNIDFETVYHEDNGCIIYPDKCTTEYLLQLARYLVIDCINCDDWGDIAEVEII